MSESEGVSATLVRASAARHARRVLETVWWGIAPQNTVPVDPVRIAGELGIGIIEAQLPANASGGLIKEAGSPPTILVNRGASPNHQRFAVAHELGHFAWRSSNRDDPECVIDYRDTLSSEEGDQEEIFANSFAAELLMPADEVERLDEQFANAAEMALWFHVAQEAMDYRLTLCGSR